MKLLGESHLQAVRRHKSLERALHSRGAYDDFHLVEEYFEKDHAELVPADELEKPTSKVFYLPMHTVYKESSNTTKVVQYSMHRHPPHPVSLSTTVTGWSHCPLSPCGSIDPFSSEPHHPHHGCQSHVPDGSLGRV